MHTPRVLVLFNEPTLPPDHPDAEAEHDILYTADCVAKVLTDAGLVVGRLGVTADPESLLAGLRRERPDAVFNLFEGTAAWGNSEAYAAGLLELLRIPYTGSQPSPLLLCRSKPLTKQLLAGAGLPTAPFVAVDSLPVPPCPIPFPVIVKPGTEDASVGIDQASVCTTQEQLGARVEYILKTYGPPVLVEQFVRGREFNVAVWAPDGTPRTLPFSEILFIDQDDADPLWPIVSFDAKWHPNSRDFKATPARNPADVTPELQAEVDRVALKAYELLGCRDYARVDLRVDEAGRPYVLEVNPNPCISPLAGLAAGLETARVPFAEFVLSLVRAALRRGANPELATLVGEATTPAAVETHGTLPAASVRRGWVVRPARATDAGNLIDLTAGCEALTMDERAGVARRLRQRLRRKDRGGATVLSLAGRGRIGGFAVLGPADPVHGDIPLETVAVDPARRRAGFGRQLLAAAEEAATSAGGRMLTAYVSSGPSAAGARQFLARVGFRSAGEIPDFYKDGTSRLTYAKPLPAAVPASVPAGVT